jgi:endoglucanase Acf2
MLNRIRIVWIRNLLRRIGVDIGIDLSIEDVIVDVYGSVHRITTIDEDGVLYSINTQGMLTPLLTSSYTVIGTVKKSKQQGLVDPSTFKKRLEESAKRTKSRIKANNKRLWMEVVYMAKESKLKEYSSVDYAVEELKGLEKVEGKIRYINVSSKLVSNDVFKDAAVNSVFHRVIFAN